MKIAMLFDVLKCSLMYGSSFNEYFYYEFWHKKNVEIKEYATMGFMYEYQKKNNPPKERIILSNKKLFFKEYSGYLGREWMDLSVASKQDICSFIKGKEKVVVKGSTGGGGKNVKVLNLRDFSVDDIIKMSKKYDIIEEYVYQHKSLMNLSPNSLNTIRVITQYADGKVYILGTILRLGIYKNTDNLSSGGLACNVDTKTGIIDTDGISFDITKINSVSHPVSGVKFKGFQIPMWDKVIDICENIAKEHPQNKSVGWDVAITNEKPIIIEGNHDWGARLWQMPRNKGMKKELEKFL